MSTELAPEAEAAQVGRVGEGISSIDKNEMSNEQLDEIFGKPVYGKEKPNAGPGEFTGVGVDREGHLSVITNDSGTLNVTDELRKEMLKAENGKHELNVDGKEFRYLRDADGVTLYTPDGNHSARMDNNGMLVESPVNNKKRLDDAWN